MNRSAEFPARDRRVRGAGLEQRVLARFRRLRLPTEPTILLGFSGGPDSLALAGILSRIASLGRFKVVAVHVDHRLRVESCHEQADASALASRLGVSFRAELALAPPATLHPGVGIEEAARRERYLAFVRAARDEQAAIVALAHHQQDQAETVLMHLARGAGLTGASGMAERARLAVPWWTAQSADEVSTLTIWRPLLSEPRSLVLAYGVELGLPPIQDRSNDDLRFRRNAIRHNVLPALERSIPGATGALVRFSQLAADDDAALTSIAISAETEAIDTSGGLDPRTLRLRPIAVQRRVLRAWVQNQSGYSGLTVNRVEAMLNLVQNPSTASHIEIGDGLVAAIVGRLMCVGTLDALTQRTRLEFPGPLFPAWDNARDRRIDLDRGVSIDGWRINVRPMADRSPVGRSLNHAATVADVGDDLVLRSPQRGDTWAISGRKLSEWLGRCRVSSLVRANLVCLASRAGVHWVAGLPLPTFEERANADRFVEITVMKEYPEA